MVDLLFKLFGEALYNIGATNRYIKEEIERIKLKEIVWGFENGETPWEKMYLSGLSKEEFESISEARRIVRKDEKTGLNLEHYIVIRKNNYPL